MTVRHTIYAAALAVMCAGWMAEACRAEQSEDVLLPPPIPGREEEIIRSVLSKFPQANHEAVITFIRGEFPQELQEFRKLSVRRLDEAAELMRRLVEESMQFLEARYRNPPMYKALMRERELEKEARALAQGFRKDEGEGKQQKVEQLRKTLDEAFSLKQELMKQELNHMAAELDKLKALIAKREASRDVIVTRRLSELVGDKEHLEW